MSVDEDCLKESPQRSDSTNSQAFKRSKHLVGAAKDLFVPENESDFQYLSIAGRSISSSSCSITRASQIESIADNPDANAIFMLKQEFSWGRLQVCEDHFLRLCSRLNVHPNFLEIVRLFHEKVKPEEEALGCYTFVTNEDLPDGDAPAPAADYSISYNIKYVARHGRNTPRDPYSVRETGVYQQYDANLQKNTWILLSPANGTEHDMLSKKHDWGSSSYAVSMAIHSILFAGACEGWPDYLRWLEEEFEELVDRAHSADLEGSHFEGMSDLRYADTRKLHIMMDKFRKLRQVLTVNIQLVQQITATFAVLRKSCSQSAGGSYAPGDCVLAKFSHDQITSRNRVDALISRASGLVQLVQTVLDFRATKTSKELSYKMQELTEQGVCENKLMKKLARRSTQDTRSMMTISLISAVFLPATFLATLFGSNFFDYSEADNRLIVASDFWIYAVFAIVFSGVAVIAWAYWSRQTMSERDEEAAETAN